MKGWTITAWAPDGRTAVTIDGPIARSRVTDGDWDKVRRRPRQNDASYAVMAERYLAGDTLKTIAAPFGVSTTTVLYALRKCGIEPNRNKRAA